MSTRTFGGGHEHDTAARAIDYSAQVQLFGDVSAGFDQDLGHWLTVGVGLVGYQALAQPLRSERLGVFLAANQLDAARFTATTCVNLGFYNPLGTADLVASFCCSFRYRLRNPGNWQAVFSEQLLTLILVKIHAFYRLR